MQTIETYSEQAIIEQILHGEKSLYELIVRRFNPVLYKIGRSYNYNHEDTQDLMQETYIDAYKNLNDFEGRSNFKTWIIRIMLNNCFRKKEKASFKNEMSKDLNENSTIMFSAHNKNTEEIIHNKELGYVIESALLKIPENYRLVFSLRAINSLSTAETASLLDISEANVKTRLNRAKTLLRAEMEKSYVAEELFEFNLIYCNALTENVMKKISEL